MNKIFFCPDGETEAVGFFVLEETRISGMDYILVADTLEGDGNCYILKDVSEAESPEAVYEMVENSSELDYLMGIFSQLLDDVDIELE